MFTDLEGSTSLWERNPVAMQAELARHDGLLRRAIESVGGYIVKSTGDGVLAAFGAATDGLAACLAAQRALQGPQSGASTPESAADSGDPISLKVRIGLHTGVAEFRDGDYFGVALNRAARIMSAAHGGQVLVSAATAELVRGELPEGVTLREMGEHRLKGMLAPERLVQVVAQDLRADFPPLESQVGGDAGTMAQPRERGAVPGDDARGTGPARRRRHRAGAPGAGGRGNPVPAQGRGREAGIRAER